MAPRYKSKTRPTVLAIPISDAERAEIKRAAQLDDRPTATFCRRIILATIRESQPVQHQPQRQRARLSAD